MSKHINLSGLKTLLEPLVHLINKKAECPDWNENNPDSLNYINGRTHYENFLKQDILKEKIIIDSNGEWFQKSKDLLILGTTYFVNFDGQIYSCQAKSTFEGGVYIGNIDFPYMLWDLEIPDVSSNEPFFIVTYEESTSAVILTTEGEHTVTIEGIIIEKIDEKYLPGVLGKQGQGFNSVFFNSDTNIANGNQSYVEGEHNYIDAYTYNSHSEGAENRIYASIGHAEGYQNIIGRQAGAAHVEGAENLAKGNQSHAEGHFTIAAGNNSHAEGVSTNNKYWANIYKTDTLNTWKFQTYSSYPQPHIGEIIQVYSTYDNHAYSFGLITDCTFLQQSSSGYTTYSLTAEFYPEIEFSDYNGHIAQLINGIALGDGSHTEGKNIIAIGENQHVQGQYNISNTTSAHIVGNGTDSKRSNAHTLDWDGNAWYAGDVYIGSTSGTNKDEGSKKLATEDFVSNAISAIPTPDVSGQITEAMNELRQEILGGEW